MIGTTVLQRYEAGTHEARTTDGETFQHPECP